MEFRDFRGHKILEEEGCSPRGNEDVVSSEDGFDRTTRMYECTNVHRSQVLLVSRYPDQLSRYSQYQYSLAQRSAHIFLLLANII